MAMVEVYGSSGLKNLQGLVVNRSEFTRNRFFERSKEFESLKNASGITSTVNRVVMGSIPIAFTTMGA